MILGERQFKLSISLKLGLFVFGSEVLTWFPNKGNVIFVHEEPVRSQAKFGQDTVNVSY